MNLNKCIFTGRIAQTPELRTTPTGKSVCKFSIAVENGYGDSNSGNRNSGDWNKTNFSK